MGWFRRNDEQGVTADEVVALRARIDELGGNRYRR